MTKYCNRLCQKTHWRIHKVTCLIKPKFKIAKTGLNDGDIKKFLLAGMSFTDLKKITKGKKDFKSNMVNKYMVWEYPTKEQLIVLSQILLQLLAITNSTFVSNVGAGRGLMEAALDEYKVPIKASDVNPRDNPFIHINKMDASEVLPSENSKILYICWLHNNYENKISEDFDYIVISGEPSGSSYSEKFTRRMELAGFTKTIFQTKGFCANDHQHVFTWLGKNIGYSCTTIFHKHPIEKLQYDKSLVNNYPYPSVEDFGMQSIIDFAESGDMPYSLVNISKHPEHLSVFLNNVLMLFLIPKLNSYEQCLKACTEEL